MILRPEIPVVIVGPKGAAQFQALVDTGADNSIFPKRVAESLGIALASGTGPDLTTFGGQRLQVFFGDVEIEIAEAAERLRWRTRVQNWPPHPTRIWHYRRDYRDRRGNVDLG